MLEDLLSQLMAASAGNPQVRPILVKLAPDLNDAELDDALGAVLASGVDGIIATNTTIGRQNLRSSLKSESGGLSGAPLTHQSQEMVSQIYRRINGRLPIIGVGGIMNPVDAKAMLDAGATLVQVYTGLVYAGPGLVVDILRSLSKKQHGPHACQ